VLGSPFGWAKAGPGSVRRERATPHKLVRVVGDPGVGTLVVEHRDRLARVGVEHQGAVLAGRVVVVESSERMDDLVPRRGGRRTRKRRTRRAWLTSRPR
jgi:hypothetical protein